jgi:hypothetical protein
VLSVEKRSTGSQEAKSQRITVSPPIHLPFHTFEAIDLAFNLALTPGQRTSGSNRRTILLHTLRQADHLSYVALLRSSEPVAEFVGFLLHEYMHEVLAHLDKVDTSVSYLV